MEEEIARPVEELLHEFSDPAITSDPVRMYLREMGRTSLLTGDEEIDLSAPIRKGKAAEAGWRPSLSWTSTRAMSC